MALQILRTSTAGQVPATLLPGQLAINLVDNTLFFADNNGVVQTLQVSTTNGQISGPAANPLPFFFL